MQQQFLEDIIKAELKANIFIMYYKFVLCRVFALKSDIISSLTHRPEINSGSQPL